MTFEPYLRMGMVIQLRLIVVLELLFIFTRLTMSWIVLILNQRFYP